MVEIIDLTSSPEPEPKRRKTANSYSAADSPFRQSSHKRQKISHNPRDDDDDDDHGEDSGKLLHWFKSRPTPPARTGLTSPGTSAQQATPRNGLRQDKLALSQPRFPIFTDTTIALLKGLRGLGDSYTNIPYKKTKLTEEQDDPASRSLGNLPTKTQTAPVHGNGVRTSVSNSSQGKTAYALLSFPRDYPHGLPLPKPHASSSQPASPPVRKTPIPLPTRSPARPATAHGNPSSPRPIAVPVPPARAPPSFPAATLTRIAPQHKPAAHSPATHSRPAPPPPCPASLPVVSQSDSAKQLKYPPWSEEEDCLIVYLKQGLQWSFKQIAPLLPGRSQGAASTRYCNRLKYGYDMRKAIDVVSRSKWAYVLQPEEHADILSHQVLQAPKIVKEKDLDIRPRPNGQSSAAGATIASHRERRAAQRPSNYYAKDRYMTDEDVMTAEPNHIPEAQQGRANNIGLSEREVEGASRKSRRLQGPMKQLRSFKPYLSHQERSALRQGFDEGDWQETEAWNGVKLHVPFAKEELQSLEHVVASIYDEQEGPALRELTEPQILEVASYANSFLPTRTKESIEAFLRDAADQRLSKEALRLHILGHGPSISSVLRSRELGMRTTTRDYSKPSTTHLQSPVFNTIGPSLSFMGTSGDVNTVAWSPNGTHFAAGSACLVDSNSMQYNRRNNLLFGDVSCRSLYELADHYTKRRMPESGVNSNRSMHVTQDPRLFQTVSMVAFSSDGSLMFSAGYDKKVRIYDITGNRVPEGSDVTLRHRAKVDLLSVSAQDLIATGCQRSKQNSIKVINSLEAVQRCHEEDFNPVVHNFSSRKAAERPENGIFPSALRFDPTGLYLLAGFASTSKEELTSGETCLWDIQTGERLAIAPETRNVFDVAWNPWCQTRPLFAVGCVAGANVNRGVRSVVKMYDVRAPSKYGLTMELDCPALDMNDILYCPFDENLIIAGCTNGKTYVWDLRRPHPEDYLCSLVHGYPLMELGEDDEASRERLDTGVRFCSWGHDRRHFYTGSSDGVVKVWDPYRALEDLFVKDVVQLNSGVMSGAFSPDYTSLLLGEVNGTVNLLEVGQCDRSIKDMDHFELLASEKMPTFEEDPEDQQDVQNTQDEVQDENSGIATARSLLETGRMTLLPIGSLPIRQAVQGPNYTGPWDKSDDADQLRKSSIAFQRSFSGPLTAQCEIPACRDATTSKLVPEEAGDSGRSADRIPNALRSLGRQVDEKKKKSKMVVTPTLKCSQCRFRPARPRPDDGGDGHSKPLCERCGFSCLRCGGSAQVLGERVDEILCSACALRWRADVLGYRLLSERRSDASGSVSGERTQSKTQEMALGSERLIGDDYLDDEYDNCVDEYYHSLWQDQPPSPL